MPTPTMTAPDPTPSPLTVLRDGTVEERSKKAAGYAVERLAGDRLSPKVKEAASDAIAPWAARLVRWLDGYMLDPIIGFVIPGAGDAITGTGSVALLFLALKERVPTIVLLRMCMNILVDTVGGFLPFIGDAFDIVWRSNRKNLDLIEKYRDDPKAEPTWADYALVGLGVTLAVLSILIPIFIIYGLGLLGIAGIASLFD